MRITRLETIQFDDDCPLTDTEKGNDITMLRVHTDEGVVGLGETYPLGKVEAASIHGPIAEGVLGRDPRESDRLRDDLVTRLDKYSYTGGEHRAMSALDIALWDIKGKLADLPIYELLGGAAHDAIPVYNTCYDNQYDFFEEPVELADSLLDQGISSLKIWPFDRFAAKTRGQRISSADLEAGLRPIRAIHEGFGTEIDVAVEFHGRWALTPAKKLVRAVEDYDPLWVEDVIRKSTFETYERLAASTEVPLCISERLMGRYEYKQAIDTGAIDVVMPDVSWTGGITEGKAIATLAETAQLPIAPHNCSGPILHRATAHLCANTSNLYCMETIRDRYDGWHDDLVTDGLSTVDGALPLPEGPGLGTELAPGLAERSDTTVRTTSL